MRWCLAAMCLSSVIISGCAANTDPDPQPLPSTTTYVTDIPDDTSPMTVDQIAKNITRFWMDSQGLDAMDTVKFVGADVTSCDGGDTMYPTSRAVYCGGSKNVVYSESLVGNLMAKEHGAIAVEIVFAHEAGHAIQDISGSAVRPGGSLAKKKLDGSVTATELSADCFAGMYMRTSSASDPDIEQALRMTHIGSHAGRKAAFELGRSVGVSAPKLCLSEYGG